MNKDLNQVVDLINKLSKEGLNKLLKLLNENFNFNTKKEIKNWLDEMEIKYYTINKDLTVDVNEDVYISFKNLSEIPIQFGIINGGFYCSDNKLTSLKGCPERIKGNFHCDDNNLETLEGCPEEVGWNFACSHNPKLTYEYLNNYDFSFVKRNLYTEYKDINKKWNNKII